MIFLLLILFQIKHFVADFPLQNKYMLQKFRPDWGFFFPLLAHSALHGLGTLIIGLIYLSIQPVGVLLIDLGDKHTTLSVYLSIVLLALLDMIIHFTMDRIKAGPKYLGRFKLISAERFKQIETERLAGLNVDFYNKELKENTYFWWSLGIDQSVHHLTHYLIIYLLLRG